MDTTVNLQATQRWKKIVTSVWFFPAAILLLKLLGYAWDYFATPAGGEAGGFGELALLFFILPSLLIITIFWAISIAVGKHFKKYWIGIITFIVLYIAARILLGDFINLRVLFL